MHSEMVSEYKWVWMVYWFHKQEEENGFIDHLHQVSEKTKHTVGLFFLWRYSNSIGQQVLLCKVEGECNINDIQNNS